MTRLIDLSVIVSFKLNPDTIETMREDESTSKATIVLVIKAEND